MARESLVDVVVAALLERIADGRTPPGDLLPPEAELAEENEVSRLTLREALKVLQTQGVVEVERGRGTRVLPAAQWTSIRAVAHVHDRSGGADAPLHLLQLRRMVETGAAELAAAHRTDADLADLERHLDTMRAAHGRGDVEAFVAADIAFHDVVLHASGNPFVAVRLGPLSAVLRARRHETSRHEPVQAHAIAEHAGGDGVAHGPDPEGPAALRAALTASSPSSCGEPPRPVPWPRPCPGCARAVGAPAWWVRPLLTSVTCRRTVRGRALAGH